MWRDVAYLVAAWVVGALCLTISLQGWPFLQGMPQDAPGSLVPVTITDRAYENLTGGPERDGGGHFVLSFETREPGSSPGYGSGRVTQDRYNELTIGETVSAVQVHGRLLLEDDVRWERRARTGTWILLGASVLFVAEGLRRGILLLHGRPAAGSAGNDEG